MCWLVCGDCVTARADHVMSSGPLDGMWFGRETIMRSVREAFTSNH